MVIGGGVIGTSIAYHLGHLGWSDTVLIERDQLTSGTTWHAAGLMVTFGSTSETSTELRKYTRDLYARLETETGLATGFKPVGFVELAADADRLEEYRRVAAFNRYCGIDVEEISPREVADLFPLARTDDLLAGFHVSDHARGVRLAFDAVEHRDRRRREHVPRLARACGIAQRARVEARHRVVEHAVTGQVRLTAPPEPANETEGRLPDRHVHKMSLWRSL